MAPLSVLVSYLAATIKAQTDPPDISAVMSDVEDLLNDSIATEGYRIGPASQREALINLSEIDFEALQAKFAQGHKHTEAEKLKQLIEGKLAQMVAVISTRIDLAEKFQKPRPNSRLSARVPQCLIPRTTSIGSREFLLVSPSPERGGRVWCVSIFPLEFGNTTIPS